MTIPHVVLATVPGYGHVTPLLDVVGELVAQGVRVTAACGTGFAPMLADAGAATVEYEGPADAHAVAAALTGVTDFGDPLGPVLARLADDPPDVLGFDATMWLAGRVLAHLFPCPTVQLSPCFVSNADFSLPGRVAAHVSAGEPVEVDMVAVLARLGVVGDLGAVLSDSRDRKVVFLPREFQFAGDTFDDRHTFVGPCLGPRRLAGSWAPPADGNPVLLVSLGTSSFNDQPAFFRACARAFEGLPWNLVLTLGSGTDPAELEPLPPNVTAHRWLPHPAVLAHAAAFVCPGGMGSIMESLSCSTPMVVVPQHGEQEVNAERVVELGLGSRLSRDDLTPETIRDAVLTVATDPATAARVRAMSTHCQTAGGHQRAAKEILSTLP
ncbi:glycosyltransferase [Actinokineospora auranticolor]|uniref:dTDP-L-oleandrosyltransferase n=1 Tax=Actinokineospora auranticolor TaxID=155976 RepID=A0A2S6H1G0_9PSEU|nr:macrolide family glycosyltransferase [Actinokineospora auranticolor]PPK71302.1 dTDP-L-oleandrosyltransferase [Actinokineospora auranticolor]